MKMYLNKVIIFIFFNFRVGPVSENPSTRQKRTSISKDANFERDL